MVGKIVVFGATGYTGTLVAHALVERGAHPVLAARSAERVAALAEELGGLETQVADVHDPASVGRLVGRGDVLVSTVGPFARWGAPAVEAAIATGAHYLDSTGEPAFIRRIFEDYGPRARQAGSTLVTAFGYDFVPGNLAGALALEAAGPEATSIAIGYFHVSVGASGGTAASSAGAMLAPSFAYRAGRIHHERPAARVRSFDVGGEQRRGLSVGGTEHFALPLLHPGLQNVEVIMGRAGPSVTVAPLVTGALAVANRLPGLGHGLRAILVNRTPGSTGGPDAAALARGSCTVVAEARSRSGGLLQRVQLDGPASYAFTGDLMAWGAMVAAEKGLGEPGASGPVQAFGFAPLTAGVAEAGLLTGDPAGWKPPRGSDPA